jgi:hypothetical protein
MFFGTQKARAEKRWPLASPRGAGLTLFDTAIFRAHHRSACKVFPPGN